MRALSVLLAVGAAWAAVSMTNASSTPDASIANVYDLWDSVRKLYTCTTQHNFFYDTDSLPEGLDDNLIPSSLLAFLAAKASRDDLQNKTGL